MKKTLMILCMAGAFAAACATFPRSDLAVLQGTWKGEETGRSTEGKCRLVISGNSLLFRGADTNEWYKGTFALKEQTSPKQLVGKILDCPEPKYIGKEVQAIYRIETGTLTLTGNEPGNPQVPAGFDAPGARTFVLKKP